jgi:uncharacterized protein
MKHRKSHRSGRFARTLGMGAAAAMAGFAARRYLQVGGSAGADLLVEGRPGAAVITGASSGLGAAYARELASRGLDLLLVARRKDLLETLGEELTRDCGVAVEVMAADLSNPEDVERVAGRVAGMGRLVLLVNNAGFASPGRWVGVDMRRHLDMIHVHDAASAYLTRAALPGMVARGNGYVVNTASMAAFIPLADDANYCATKAYLVTFSLALASELHGTGVRIQALCPGFLLTDFYDVLGPKGYDRNKVPSVFWTEAEPVVRDSLAALGARVIVVPGTLNRVVVGLARQPLLTPLFAMGARLWRRA